MLPISLGRRAIVLSGPRVAEDIADLEVRAIRGFLEYQVFGKVRCIVSDMESGEKHVLGLSHAFAHASVLLLPKHAKAAEFLGGKGIRRTGIAPIHVPGIFQEHTA